MSLAGIRERLTRRRVVVGALLAIVLVTVAFLGWSAFRVWKAWDSVPRVPFDLEASRLSLDNRGPTAATTPSDIADGLPDPQEFPVLDVPDEDFDAYLVLGSDETERKPTLRADAVLLFLLPRGGDAPALVSIPRDLLVRNPCDGRFQKVSLLLEGCGEDVTGPELLALAVADLTGIEVDHFGLFGFEAFRRVINYVGGIQICVDHAVRVDEATGILLPEGCSNARGVTALRWVRLRTGEELVDGRWEALPRLGDAERSKRQRTVILQLLNKLKRFRSPQRVAEIAEALSDAFVIDDSLSMGRAVDLVWDLRRIDGGKIRQPALQTETSVTSDGGFAVVLVEPFSDVLIDTYPHTADYPLASGS